MNNPHDLDARALKARLEAADRDYQDMRRFQRLYIEADHERAALKQRNEKLEATLRDMATVTEEELHGSSPFAIANAIRRIALKALEVEDG